MSLSDPLAAGAGPMTFYEIEGNRIVDSRSDDNCLFRDYGPLGPVKR
jgi:hypothetical protein